MIRTAPGAASRLLPIALAHEPSATAPAATSTAPSTSATAAVAVTAEVSAILATAVALALPIAAVVPAEAATRAPPSASSRSAPSTTTARATSVVTVLSAIIPGGEPATTASAATSPARRAALTSLVRRASTALRPDEAAKHHRRVGPPREREGEPQHPPAAELVVLLGRTDPEFHRPHDRRARLRLQLEARDVRQLEVLRAQLHPLEDALEERSLLRIVHAVKALTGKDQRLVPVRGQQQLALGNRQPPLDPGETEAVRAVLVDPVGQRPVPEVRLEGIQVDQALARPHPTEGPCEVVAVALEVLEDRVIAAELARDRATGGPVPPAAPQGVLEPPLGGRLVGRRARDEPLQCAAHVPLDEVKDDPPLSMPDVSKALLVEVVRQSVLTDRLQGVTNSVAVGPVEVTYHDAELVPDRGAGVQRRRRPPDGLNPKGPLLHADRGAALDAHVLGGHPLTVLEARHGDVRRGHADEVRQLGGGLH